MLDQRGQLLRAPVGFAGLSRLSHHGALWALRTWLDPWAGIGRVAAGMHRHGYDLQLTQYDERAWRATFYVTGMEHSPTSATGTAWERTPWRATQRAAWEALKKVACLIGVLAVASACSGHPRILSGFGDLRGGEGYIRQDGPHQGVDIAGVVGDAVLAPADGYVVVATDSEDACGNKIIIKHLFGYITIYCHLSSFTVRPLDDVKRGDVIGYIGTTGRRPGVGYEHVHWELRIGSTQEDPLLKTVGCFDPMGTYPTDDLVLTYPVRCGKAWR